MNEAFLMKIVWSLNNKPNDLWCRVLYSKYRRNNDLKIIITSQPYHSPLWKALTRVWNDFQRNVIWQIGDDNSVNFWLDK
jgi:hypothetical protein